MPIVPLTMPIDWAHRIYGRLRHFEVYNLRIVQGHCTTKKTGGQAIAVPGDVLNDAYIKTLIEKAAEFGNEGSARRFEPSSRLRFFRAEVRSQRRQ